MKKDKIIIFTDGGSRGNPGISGAGAVIFDNEDQEIKTTFKFLGLEMAYDVFGNKLSGMEVEMKMDSQLVQRQLKGEYKVKEKTLFSQYVKVKNLIDKHFKDISFVHIPRGENKRADELANQAMDEGI